MIEQRLHELRESLRASPIDEGVRAQILACVFDAEATGDVALIAKAHVVLAEYHFSKGQQDQTVTIAERALAAAAGKAPREEADLLYLLGRTSMALTDVTSSLSYFERAIAILQEHSIDGVVKVYLRYGEALGKARRFSDAAHMLEKALRSYEAINDVYGAINCCNRLTLHYIHTGMYAKAMEYAYESLTLLDAEPNDGQKASAFKSLCIIHTRLGMLPRAIEYGVRGLDVSRRVHGPLPQADMLGCVGDAYYRSGDVGAALHYFTEAAAFYQQGGSKIGQGFVYTSLAVAYRDGGKYDDALKLVDQVIDIFTTGNYTLGLAAATLIKVSILIHMGLLDDADALLTTIVADESTEPQTALDIYAARVTLADARGDATSAARYQLLLQRLSVHVFSNEAITEALERFRSRELPRRGSDLPTLDLLFSTSPAIPAPPPPKPIAAPIAPVPAITSTRTPSFTITTFGSFVVRRNGEEISPEQWKRKKARDVFKYLLLRYRRSVTPEEIITALWGEDADVDACIPTLQNSVSFIRTALEPHLKPRQPSSYLVFRDGAYLLDFKDAAEIDLFTFLTTLDERRNATSTEQQISMLTAATQLYTGDLLPDDRYDDWTAPMRDECKERCIEALLELSQLHFDAGNTTDGTAAVRRVLQLDDTYEEAYEVLISELLRTGRSSDAERVFESAKKAYQREYNSLPPSTIATLVTKR